MTQDSKADACTRPISEAPRDGRIIRATNRVMAEDGKTMMVKWGPFQHLHAGETITGEDWLLVKHDGEQEWMKDGVGHPCRPTHWCELEPYEAAWRATCGKCEENYFSEDDFLSGEHPCPSCESERAEDPGKLVFSHVPYGEL